MPMVIKKDGRREAFDLQKIYNGVKIACKKRPISMDKIEELVKGLENRVKELGEKEVHSNFVGNEVMKSLYKLDHVAYVRFASVYREFKDVNEFMEELKHLMKKEKK